LNGVAAAFREIYEVGVRLKNDVDAHLKSWPMKDNLFLRGDELTKEYESTIEQLQDRTYKWFNDVKVHVLPHTTHDRAHLTRLLRNVSAAIAGRKYYIEYRPAPPLAGSAFARMLNPQPKFNEEMETTLDVAIDEAHESMAEALRIVRTAAPESVATAGRSSNVSHIPNTAFIIMWMDPNRPQLGDVHQIVKETFAEYGIDAFRADDVEHQDSITQVVLENIARSEFLFADLSGARPNVYYEVGYAHALGKRPILFREHGTPLHFDLSVHNVPEYKSILDLRQKLRDRLSAVTGREPQK